MYPIVSLQSPAVHSHAVMYQHQNENFHNFQCDISNALWKKTGQQIEVKVAPIIENTVNLQHHHGLTPEGRHGEDNKNRQQYEARQTFGAGNVPGNCLGEARTENRDILELLWEQERGLASTSTSGPNSNIGNLLCQENQLSLSQMTSAVTTDPQQSPRIGGPGSAFKPYATIDQTVLTGSQKHPVTIGNQQVNPHQQLQSLSYSNHSQGDLDISYEPPLKKNKKEIDEVSKYERADIYLSIISTTFHTSIQFLLPLLLQKTICCKELNVK